MIQVCRLQAGNIVSVVTNAKSTDILIHPAKNEYSISLVLHLNYADALQADVLCPVV